MARNKNINIRVARASRKGTAMGQKVSGFDEHAKKDMRGKCCPYTNAETKAAWNNAFNAAAGL